MKALGGTHFGAGGIEACVSQSNKNMQTLEPHFPRPWRRSPDGVGAPAGLLTTGDGVQPACGTPEDSPRPLAALGPRAPAGRRMGLGHLPCAVGTLVGPGRPCSPLGTDVGVATPGPGADGGLFWRRGSSEALGSQGGLEASSRPTSRPQGCFGTCRPLVLTFSRAWSFTRGDVDRAPPPEWGEASQGRGGREGRAECGRAGPPAHRSSAQERAPPGKGHGCAVPYISVKISMNKLTFLKISAL